MRGPDDLAAILYTSGTTGRPRGVCLDAETLFTVAGSLVDAASAVAPRRHLCLMPLATLLENVAGLYATLLADAEIALPSLSEIGYTGATGLDVPTLLRCLHRYQPESVILVPQLLLALVMAAEQGAPWVATIAASLASCASSIASPGWRMSMVNMPATAAPPRVHMLRRY